MPKSEEFYITLGKVVAATVQAECETTGHPPADGVRAALGAATAIAIMYDELDILIRDCGEIVKGMKEVRRDQRKKRN